MLQHECRHLCCHHRFDSGEQEPMAKRLLSVTKTYLGARDKCRDAAASLASTFLTRPDTKSTLLPSFLEWAVQAMSAPSSMDGDITGALTALCAVMKHGKREDLVEEAPNILTSLLAANFKESSNTNIRKLSLKLVQRLGMIFLKVRIYCSAFLFSLLPFFLRHGWHRGDISGDVVALPLPWVAPRTRIKRGRIWRRWNMMRSALMCLRALRR